MQIRNMVQQALALHVLPEMVQIVDEFLGQPPGSVPSTTPGMSALGKEYAGLEDEATREDRFRWVVDYLVIALKVWRSGSAGELPENGFGFLLRQAMEPADFDDALRPILVALDVDGGFASMFLEDDEIDGWEHMAGPDRFELLMSFAIAQIESFAYAEYGLPEDVVSYREFKIDFNPLLERDTRDANHRTFFDIFPNDFVWTVVQVDNDKYIVPGRQLVNYVSSIVTETPWNVEFEGKTVEYQEME